MFMQSKRATNLEDHWQLHEDRMVAISNKWWDRITRWIAKHAAIAFGLGFVCFTIMTWVLPTFGSWLKAGFRWCASVVSCLIMLVLTYEWFEEDLREYFVVRAPRAMQEYMGAMGASVYPPIMYILSIGIDQLIIKGIEHRGYLSNRCVETIRSAAELWAGLLQRGVTLCAFYICSLFQVCFK